jgi:hypothetical protein
MRFRDKAALREKIDALDKQLVEGGGGFLEEFNARSLRDSLAGELNELESSPTESARVELTFRGKPVFGTKGIEADFGLEASEGFQRAVHRRSANLAKAISPKGLAPPRPLAIVDVARSSFGFVMEEILPEDGQLQGPSNLCQAMEDVQSIFDLVKGGDEGAFIERMRTLDGGTAQAIKEFLEIVDGAQATFRVRTEDRDTLFEAKDVAAATHWVQMVDLAEDTVQMLGVLAGVFTVSRKVEFVPEGRKVIGAAIGATLDAHELLTVWAEKPCLATLQVQHRRPTGRPRGGRPTYTLLAIEAHPNPSPSLI